MGDVIAKLYHFCTDNFCYIKKKIGEKKGNKKYSEERLEKIDSEKKEGYGKYFLKKISIKNQLEEKRKAHSERILIKNYEG